MHEQELLPREGEQLEPRTLGMSVDELTAQAVAQYSVSDAAIEAMRARYMGLAIRDASDAEGLATVHDARMSVKGARVAVEKTRKALKADALEYGRRVDAEAARLTALLAPIEEHLHAQEKTVQEERARIKAEADRRDRERLDRRVAQLHAYGSAALVSDVAAMTDEGFAAELEKARAEHAERERQREEQRAAEERAAAERMAQEEQIAIERAELDRERKKLEEDRRAEQHRLELEQARAEAAAKAKREAEEAARRAEEDRVAREKAQAEEARRREASRPEADRLRILADRIEAVEHPDLPTQGEWARCSVAVLVQEIRDRAAEMTA